MVHLQDSNDLFLNELHKLLQETEKPQTSIPTIQKPHSYSDEGIYSFPEDIGQLTNEDLATLSLQFNAWRGYALTELSKAENRRRKLQEKYEYIYETLLVQEKIKIFKMTGDFINDTTKEGTIN